MIKTLKIFTFILGLIAVGAIVAVVLLSLRPDREFEDFISKEGEIHKFIASAKSPPKQESPESPLIEQAEIFTLRIDPPLPEPAVKAPPRDLPGGKPPTPVRRPPPSAKFTLEGTVVASNPAFSTAMVKTTAKGIRWYRPSEKIGHLTIEEILKDRIVINDGTKTYEMKVPVTKKISLIKGDPNNPYSGKKNPYKSMQSQTDYTPEFAPASRTARQVPATSVQPESTEATAEMMKENIEFLSKFATDPESMGISKEEAEQLGDMGDLLGAMEEEMKKLEEEEKRKAIREIKSRKSRRSPRRSR